MVARTLSPKSSGLSEDTLSRITIDVIHDGEHLPQEFTVDAEGRAIPEDLIEESYVRERDWGALMVAERIAVGLGLTEVYTVNTARCLMDFGRFPGVSRKGASHLGRAAVNEPFASRLSSAQARKVLEDHYDAISNTMDSAIRGRQLKIAVHTYDRTNPTGTERPQVSIVSRAQGYQNDGVMPYGVFDPLYPDILAEFTVDRILPSRIGLVLERAGVPVAHNYPYLLPEGSPEVRHQVWSFFDWLQARWEAERPDTEGDPAYLAVWEMLKDTNLRSAEAGSLRAYIHRLRRAPPGEEAEFSEAEEAYRRLVAFVGKEGEALVKEYRFSPDRAMSFGIEVRKDLLYRFDDRGRPLELCPERGLKIADLLAEAILIYLTDDRPRTERSSEWERGGRWYAPGGQPGR
jgi:hypothetical protein